MGAKCERLGSYALLIFDCMDAVVDRLALTGVDFKESWIFQAYVYYIDPLQSFVNQDYLFRWGACSWEPFKASGIIRI